MPSLPLALSPPADLVAGVRVMLALLAGLTLATAIVVRPGRAAAGMLRAQVTSWWFLLPPVFAAWALYPLGVSALVLAISALAARELADLSDAPGAARLRRRFLGLLVAQAALDAAGLEPWGAAAMLAFAAVHFRVWRAAAATRRDGLLQALFGLQAAGLGCLVILGSQPVSRPPSATWFLYLCVVTALNDIGQFLVGTRFGRHKLAARVSPNKTWQGVGGGLASSVLFSMAVGHALGLASLPWLCGMGIALCVAGLAGDLLFSAAKRLLGIKDYSGLIPGHGGILDRVDSLVLTAPVLLLALRFA
jgi:phosphatidate cytidylyltransferase